MRKFLQRFLFIFTILYTAPWGWMPNDADRHGGLLHSPYGDNTFIDLTELRFVQWVGLHIFNLNVAPGNPDSSYSYFRAGFYVLIALIGAVVWTLLRRNGAGKAGLERWTPVLVRYYLASRIFLYGFSKVFGIQFLYPGLFFLSKPLGELAPKQLAWIFFGYSRSYQCFLGLGEVTAATLLLFRKTTTLGACLLCIIMANVVFLNLVFDINVKLDSIFFLLLALYLVALDARRMVAVFFYHEASPPDSSAAPLLPAPLRKWRPMLKFFFILYFGVYISVWLGSSLKKKSPNSSLYGIYDIDESEPKSSNPFHWKKIIFDYRNSAIFEDETPVKTMAYFHTDPAEKSLTIKIPKDKSKILINFSYSDPESSENRIILDGKTDREKIFLVLKKETRPFELVTHQGSWIK